jgi:hypothetical protein
MGTKLNRIEQEFVLNTLIDENIPFQLHAKTADYEAFLKSYDEKTMIFHLLSESVLQEGEDVRFYFLFQNNMHSFGGHIRGIDGNRVHITFPSGIYKALQRKHERIKDPTGISASFLLKGKSIELDFPKTDSYAIVEKPLTSMKFDESSISNLMGEFRRRMKDLASQSRLVMFREREPSGFEETLLFKSAKVLWIPSTQEPFPIEDPFPDRRLITRDQLDEVVIQGDDEQIITSININELLHRKYESGIYSEIYCPILYHQYLIGYVHIQNKVEKREKLGIGLVEYAFQFSKVLCYSLQANGYFSQVKAKEKKYETGIIDISASGLLFTHPEQELTRELLVHTDITLNLQVKQRSMSIGCRVTRKFTDRDRLYIGLQFLDILPEDFRFLYETIYNRPLDEELESQWEGGIEPPELQLN